jgi:hypothetical protein
MVGHLSQNKKKNLATWQQNMGAELVPESVYINYISDKGHY